MLFKLTDEQVMIQNMVREFSRKVIASTAAEITSIDPMSASPVLKDVMTITGSGFGSKNN